MQTLFADHILNISVTGPLVRIDLGTNVTATDAEGKPALNTIRSQQLVMPLEGFLRAFALQEGVVKKLIADGVLKAQTDASQAPAPTTEGSPTRE